MTEQFVVLKNGGWSMWDDETKRPSDVARVICATNDPKWMQKVNSAMCSEVFTEEQIKQSDTANTDGSTTA